MERVFLDVPNGGQQCKYDDINVHDVVMSEIPWLYMVVDGSTLHHGCFIWNPMLNPSSLPKHTSQPPPNHHLWHWIWSKTLNMTLGRKQIAPLNIGLLGGGTHPEELETMANMMISPFFKSATVIHWLACWYQLLFLLFHTLLYEFLNTWGEGGNPFFQTSIFSLLHHNLIQIHTSPKTK